jgi:hypothetical protein
MLREEMGIEPGGETMRVYEQIRSNGRLDEPTASC